MRHTLKSGGATSAFASLLGFGRTSAAASADEDTDDTDASAEDGPADEDDEEEEKSKKSKKAKAEDEPADEDDEDEKPESKKSKKAKAEDDEEDDGEKDKETAAARAEGRKAERRRWSKVLQSAEAGHGRVAAACEMLASTGMSAEAVIKTLAALPAGAAQLGLSARMSTIKQPQVGGDGGDAAPKAGTPQALAAAIVAAGKIRRGEK